MQGFNYGGKKSFWDMLSDKISLNVVINLNKIVLDGEFFYAIGDVSDGSYFDDPAQTIRFKNSAIDKKYKPYGLFNTNNKIFNLNPIEQGSGYYASDEGYVNLLPG